MPSAPLIGRPPRGDVMKRIALVMVVGMGLACGGVDSGTPENSTQPTADTIQQDVVRGSGFCAGATCIVYSDWGCIRTHQASCLRPPSGFTMKMQACGGVVVDPQMRCVSIVPF
jgi:hypothetical protein